MNEYFNDQTNCHYHPCQTPLGEIGGKISMKKKLFSRVKNKKRRVSRKLITSKLWLNQSSVSVCRYPRLALRECMWRKSEFLLVFLSTTSHVLEVVSTERWIMYSTCLMILRCTTLGCPLNLRGYLSIWLISLTASVCSIEMHTQSCTLMCFSHF